MRKRWILVDGKLLPEAEARAIQAQARPKSPGLTVIPDIAESFVSPVDGSTLTSRAAVREHNIRNSVVDIGNDPAYKNPKKPSTSHESSSPLIADFLKRSR